jgi:radical SAM superfamily enzyme YgiQ (UPF0313 family)
MKQVELTEQLLLSVRKPARYIGQEYNSIRKDWDKTDVKFCLCYPDLYEIGMSNLGVKILYHILNSQEDVLCERSFAPWMDMEQAMRENNIPLFSLENKAPVSEFDIVGFSFSYELSYSNMLTMLSLADIPFNREDRKSGNYPLVIAGGPCMFNPEPISDFIDLFLIGEAEEAILDIVNTYKKHRGNRSLLISEIAKIEGVYAPSVHSEGRRIKKRTVLSLDNTSFPSRPIVPYIQVVHDRIAVEIMRGCPNSCHFCQARSIYGPLRIRKKDQIIELAKLSYKNTGLDEISLLSLSSSSYPGIDALIKDLTETFLPLGVGISLPSLRIEDAARDLPALISIIKKSGLTFAPEAGTDRMLDIINKKIEKAKLFLCLKDAFAKGWRRVKLYFMIGLPHEDLEDVEAIIDFSRDIAMLRKQVSGQPAEVVVNVSTFIPKPHTYFEREGMANREAIEQKQRALITKSKHIRYLTLKFHDINTSLLEAAFSRGDKRLAQVLMRAWQYGARFDAWNESFDYGIWDRAFSDCGISSQGYLLPSGKDATLPWSYISCD